MKKIFTNSILVKNFALAVSFTLATSLFSQNAPIDFETGGQGASWSWSSFENVANAPLEIVNNPSATGKNTSAKVGKFTCLIGGQPWAGFESKHGADIGKFTLSASNAIVKIMVYKSVISDIGIKFATASGGSDGELKVANTKTNEWEELTFDFSSRIASGVSTDIDQIIFFLDFKLNPGRTSDNVCYFDNVTFSNGVTLAEPTVAAPTPTKLAANVISLFSNAYTNVTVDTWRTSWSAATLTDMQIAGNDTKKYTALDFVGVETVASQINATTMDSFHLDMWTPNATDFKVKLVDFGANGAFGGGDDVEHQLSFTPTSKVWNRISVPMSAFTGLTTKGHIAQIIFVGVPSGTSVVYIDNVMFSKIAAASNVAAIAKANVSVYPNPANDNLNITADHAIHTVSITNSIGQEVMTVAPNANSTVINTANLSTGIYTVKTTVNGVVSVAKIVIN